MIIAERGHTITQRVMAVTFQSALTKHMPHTVSLERMKHTSLSVQVEILTSIMCMTIFSSCHGTYSVILCNV